MTDSHTANIMDKLLDGIGQEGTDLSKTEDSSASETTEETAAEQDKETEEEISRLDKNPRFKEVIAEKNRLAAELEATQARIEEIESRMDSDEEEDDETIEIPAVPYYFTGSEEDWKQQWLTDQKRAAEIEERAVEKALAIMEEREQAKSEEAGGYEQWVEDGLKSLKDSGAKFDQNKFLKLMVDYQPSNEEGSLDFNKGYALYQKLEAQANPGSNARKSIADTSSSNRAVDNEGYQGVIKTY